MSLILNEEQIQLQDAARKFVQERSPVSALRKLRDENAPNGLDRELWKEMAELGWAGILIDEEFGGLGLGPLWMGLVTEECGRTLCASPLLSTAILSASLIKEAGTEEQKQALLGQIAAGELICALAIDESAHHNPQQVNCEAKKSGESYSITGEKTFVIDGHIADNILVVARLEGKLSAFIVDSKDSGLTVKRTSMVDFHNAANITFNNVPAQLLGNGDDIQAALTYTLDVANACISAELLGTTMEAFERTVEYLKTRVQFDVLIGSFQALQHRAADMFSEIELSKSVVRKALSALEYGEENPGRYASMAKAMVGETSHLVSNEGIQMFGGIGMTDEEEIGFFLKRSRVLEQILGSSSYHKKRYADLSGF